MAPAGFEHGRVAATVGAALSGYVRATGIGVTVGAETGFVLARDPDTVRAPDAAFVSRERADEVGRTAKYWPGAPDLAVEVVSPDDSFREMREKALEWLSAGSMMVVVLDPDKRTATVYRGGDGDAHVYGAQEKLDLDEAVPGFAVAVDELFA